MERPAECLGGAQPGRRSDVQQAMIARAPASIPFRGPYWRVAALDERKFVQLQGHLDELPAGGILALMAR